MMARPRLAAWHQHNSDAWRPLVQGHTRELRPRLGLVTRHHCAAGAGGHFLQSCFGESETCCVQQRSFGGLDGRSYSHKDQHIMGWIMNITCMEYKECKEMLGSR